MHWEVEVLPRYTETDLQLSTLLKEKTGQDPGVIHKHRVYLISGLDESNIRIVADRLLVDSPVEKVKIRHPEIPLPSHALTILPKPGVMDPAAASIEFAVQQLGLSKVTVRTGQRFLFSQNTTELARTAQKLLANDAIEIGIIGSLPESVWKVAGSSYTFHRQCIPLRD
ncbi:MAG TPA: phosphoribosylformylglycinamidine synthase subunit PurS, partial [Gemmatales bacterium]|nr:phosphoribosylformylglycinamidine synthase subunit PurS [Gemmatales bacterium]